MDDFMDLKQLRYFAAVAEEGSITAAARRLYLSQPPLSMQLQALEREVGCSLFERGRRHITLTDAGRVLYGYACSMLETQQSALDEIAALREGSGGVLRLGMVSSLSGTLAADWLAEFCGEQKGVRLEIYEANTYELIQRLRRRSVHLALVRQPFQAEDLLSHPLAGEAMVAVARRELLPREDASWAHLRTLALIVYRRWEALVRQKLDAAGGAGAFRCVCDDARTAVSLAERGLGVAVVPASAAGLMRGKGMVSPAIPDGLLSQIVATHPKNTPLPRPSQQFLEFLLRKYPENPQKPL